MRNLTIRKKLITSFVVVILMSLLLGIFATVFSNILSTDFNNLIDYPLERRQVATELKFEFAQVRINAFQMLISSDFDVIEARLAEMLARYDTLRDLQDRFTTAVTGDPALSQQEQQEKLAAMDAIFENMYQYRQIYNDLYTTILHTRDLSLNVIDARAPALTAEINDGLFTFYEQAVEVASSGIVTVERFALFTDVVVIAATVVLVAFSGVVAVVLIRGIMAPMRKLKSSAKQIADGDLSITMRTSNADEFGDLSNSIADMADTFKLLISSIGKMSGELEDGNLDYKLDESLFVGDYRNVAVQINNLADVIEILEIISEYAAGHFDKSLTAVSGQKAAINNMTLKPLQQNLKNISTEINDIATAVANGDFTRTIDADKYQGNWSDVMASLNSLVRNVSEPLAAIEASLYEMRDGNFEEAKISKTFTGTFENVRLALNSTDETTVEYIDEIANILGHMAQGDLTVSIRRDYAGSYAPIKAALTTILDSLNVTMSDIKSAVDQVGTGASQISTSAMYLAEGATKQTASIEELSSALELIYDKATTASGNAQTASQSTVRSQELAEEGTHAVTQMEDAMNKIKVSSESIKNIIGAITSIAFQTNLLALNASVEASRAGEHGRGFAVVADEVRTLAGRSQQSASDTEDLIASDIQNVGDGLEATKKVINSFEIIKNNIGEISEMVSQIAGISSEQLESISNINASVAEITRVITDNSATAEESAAASQELSSQVELLVQKVDYFRLR